MKTLFTLLSIFLTLQGMGQDIKSTTTTGDVELDSINAFTSIGVVSIGVYIPTKEDTIASQNNKRLFHEGERVVTDVDYYGYVLECYNDSIKYDGGWIKHFENGDYIIISDGVTRNIKTVDKCGNEYYHKKPTFPGFSEWLKENNHRK